MTASGPLLGAVIAGAFVLGAAVGAMVVRAPEPVASLSSKSADDTRESGTARAGNPLGPPERPGDSIDVRRARSRHQPAKPASTPDPGADADLTLGPLFPETGSEAELRERFNSQSSLYLMARGRAVLDRGLDEFVRRAIAQRGAALRELLGEIDHASVSTAVESIVVQFAEDRHRILAEHVHALGELERAGDAEAANAQWTASMGALRASRQAEGQALRARLLELLPKEKITAISEFAWFPGREVVSYGN